MEMEYWMPVRIVMGRGCVEKSAEKLKALGTRALLVTGAHSAKENGAQADVTRALENNGQTWVLYDRVPPNPTLDCVYEGANFARSEGVDFVIAIGGGSPMDAAKAIALLTRQEIPKAELLQCKSFTDDICPLVLVPTTAGTGSEVTPYSILTSDAMETKKSISAPGLFPRLALLDGAYMAHLPRAVAIHTALDALSHAIEGMVTSQANALTDLLAKECIRRICGEFDALSNGTLSPEGRDSLLYAATLGGMVIARTGTAAVHAMGYSLTYYRHIDHGRANALLLGAYLRFVAQTQAARVAEIVAQTPFATLDALSDAIDALLGEKERISEDEVAAYAQKAIVACRAKKCLVNPSEEDLRAILHEALA